MRRPTRFFATLALGAAVATAPLHAFAAEENTVETASERSAEEVLEPAFSVWRGFVDIAILRPLGTARLLVGTFVGLPIATTLNAIAWPVDRDTTGTVFKDDWIKYVVEPWEYTFEREIGESLSGV